MIRRVIIALVILAVAACNAGPDELLGRAQRNLDAGDFRAASIDLKRLLQQEPNNPEARMALGIALLGGGDAPGAVRELELAGTGQNVPSRGVNDAGDGMTRAGDVLLGRERELELLENVLNAACNGDPGFVVVSGEAGIGKTRLLHEVSENAASRGCLTLEGRAAEVRRPDGV